MTGAKKKSEKGGKSKKGAKKSGGNRSQIILDGVPLAAMTRDQLEGHVSRLRQELDREREERSFVQLELERTHRLWEVATQSLLHETSKARLKDAEMAAAEEYHQQQIKVLQHKMKNVIGEHQDTLADLQVAGQKTLGSLREANQREEAMTMKQLQEVHDKMAESEARYLTTIANLKVAQARELQEEREKLRAEVAAISRKHDAKLEDLTEQLELKCKTELELQEARKNKFLEEVLETQKERIMQLKEYYTEVTESNTAEIERLRASIEEQASREGAVERRIAAVEEERSRLRVENQSLLQKVADSSRAQQRSQNLEQNLKSSSRRVKQLTAEKQELQCTLETLVQKSEQLEGERDQLYEQLVTVVGEVRQRSEMRNLVLENKLIQLSDQLEKREAVLSEVLAATSMDPVSVAQVTRQLEGIIQEKNESISALRSEVASIRRLYTDLLENDQSRSK